MTQEIECFWLERTNQHRIELRRFADRDACGKCPGKYTYHNANVLIGTGEFPPGYQYEGDRDQPFDRADPRWPRKCDYCAYEFQDSDGWQFVRERLYKRRDTGELVTLREAPPGAMWDAWWYRERDVHGFKSGPDGICLMVMTPGGDWCVDGPSSNGNGWTRAGIVPKITAHPSIGMGKNMERYHGWLRDGKLVEC